MVGLEQEEEGQDGERGHEGLFEGEHGGERARRSPGTAGVGQEETGEGDGGDDGNPWDRKRVE